MEQWIIGVRHGESVKNRIRYLMEMGRRSRLPEFVENMSSRDVPLTENGLWESWRAGRWLKIQFAAAAVVVRDRKGILALMSSKHLRTRQTIWQIAAEIGASEEQIQECFLFNEIKLPVTRKFDEAFESCRGWLISHYPKKIIAGSGNQFRFMFAKLLGRDLEEIPLLRSGSITWVVSRDEGASWQIKDVDGIKILNFVPRIEKEDYQRL